MIIGFEAANSFVKIKSKDGEDVYPNIVRRLTDVEQEYDLLGTKRSGKIFEYKGERYTVGERKLGDFSSSSSRDMDRYQSDGYKIESLLAIAQHAKNGDRIRAVTGLPASHYNDKAKADITKALEGDHTVRINNEPVSFTVSKVGIILQPVGTLTHLAIDEAGYIRDNSLLKSVKGTVVVDIGWGTTDIAIMDGLRLYDHLNVEVSMLDAYTAIEKGMRKEFGRSISPFLLESQLRKDDVISFGGTRYDMAEIKRKAFDSTAKRIMSDIKNRLTLSDYDAVIFTGGGVDALSASLKPFVENEPNAKRVNDPQMANVRGFYTFGVVKSHG